MTLPINCPFILGSILITSHGILCWGFGRHYSRQLTVFNPGYTLQSAGELYKNAPDTPKIKLESLRWDPHISIFKSIQGILVSDQDPIECFTMLFWDTVVPSYPWFCSPRLFQFQLHAVLKQMILLLIHHQVHVSSTMSQCPHHSPHCISSHGHLSSHIIMMRGWVQYVIVILRERPIHITFITVHCNYPFLLLMLIY